MRLVFIVGLTVWIGIGGLARASGADPRIAAICDRAAAQVAAETAVPLDVLRAITRTETGRGTAAEPWPWTVNMEGLGKWFETEDAARAYVFRHYKDGARSFDVGCFQINYKWHGQAFRSIDEMFDPLANARYAAAFLKRLRAETGSWTEAAGAYHSRTEKHATRYKARFKTIRQALGPAPAVAPISVAAPRPSARPVQPNRYPLLLAEDRSGHLGSLMPAALAPRASLFGG